MRYRKATRLDVAESIAALVLVVLFPGCFVIIWGILYKLQNRKGYRNEAL